MGNLVSIFAALRYGASLTDPAIWKQRQNLTNSLIGLLGAVVVFLPIGISSDQVIDIVGGIVALVGVYNVYTTTATTTKIGLQPKDPDNGNTPRESLGDTSNEPTDPFKNIPTSNG